MLNRVAFAVLYVIAIPLAIALALVTVAAAKVLKCRNS